MNNWSATGRVGRDAITRTTAGGTAVTSWSLAVERGFGDNKKTEWADCSLWGERGRKLAEYIRKGAQLAIVGEVGTREHDGKTYLTVDVKDVTLLGGKPQGERSSRQQHSEPQRRSAPDDFADDDIGF